MKKNLLIFLYILIFCTLLIVTTWLIIQINQEKTIIDKTTYITQKTEQITNTIENEIKNEKQDENEINKEIEVQKENTETNEQNLGMQKQYKGYEVEAKLEIPAINLTTYVIKPYSKQALNVSVTKFWGASANEIGNFCIAGHNFQNNIMFKNLKKLKNGDVIFVTDLQNRKIAYTVKNVYTVLPKDVTCLSQKTNGKREITLITCTTDSAKRIIVKAEQT